MEPPECPVCLQSYDGACTIPRVLTCGHTACESCLSNLPQKFSLTVRCPACTVLVKYPPQGPASLPKNIDLLRLIDPTIPKSHNPKVSQNIPEVDFIPRSWSNEFYTYWKQYVLPIDSVLVEVRADEDSALHFGCLVENRSQRVSLVKLGSLCGDDDSVFKCSYFARVLNCLSGMREEARDELGLILRAGSKQLKCCEVLGLWGDMEDDSLCLVCERLNEIESLDFTRDGNGLSNDELPNFALMGMEICEAVIDLHKQGLIAGCLGISCFSFEEFFHLYVDLNDVLVTGRRVTKTVAGASCIAGKICDKEVGFFLSNLLESNVFFSPEVLYALFKIAGVQGECGECRYSIGYGSDIWPLACIFLSLLIGNQFSKELVDCKRFISTKASEDSTLDCLGMYRAWVEKVTSLLENKFGSEYVPLQLMLCQCLSFDPGSRPSLINVWKCIRELIIKPGFDKMIRFNGLVNLEKGSHCLVLGEFCSLLKERFKTQESVEVLGAENTNGSGEVRAVKTFVEGLSEGSVKFKELQGHRDCVTGLAIGGGFLFSSSFDKSVAVWSLQDFTHVHTFKGHENKVMAVIYVDEEEPLCISGDSGGGIFVWSSSFPLRQEPLIRWNEEKDWRYSGIHALASSARHLYTGSGDRTIKAWSLLDGKLLCTMSGHKSAVSTLAACNGVLYSGSRDGTIRLWSLIDHSLLTVLEGDSSGAVSSVLSLTAVQHTLVASLESGSVKVWSNDKFMKSVETHEGSVFAVFFDGKWLYTGGWDKTISLQELAGDELQVDVIPIGSISCGSVITDLLCWQGKLFVGCADRTVKVYFYGK